MPKLYTSKNPCPRCKGTLVEVKNTYHSRGHGLMYIISKAVCFECGHSGEGVESETFRVGTEIMNNEDKALRGFK